MLKTDTNTRFRGATILILQSWKSDNYMDINKKKARKKGRNIVTTILFSPNVCLKDAQLHKCTWLKKIMSYLFILHVGGIATK